MRLCIFIQFRLSTASHTIFNMSNNKYILNTITTTSHLRQVLQRDQWRGRKYVNRIRMEDIPREKERFTGWASLSILPLSLCLIYPSHEHANILQTSVQSVKAHAHKHKNADRPDFSLLKHSFLTCHCMCLVCISFPVWFQNHISCSSSPLVLQ